MTRSVPARLERLARALESLPRAAKRLIALVSDAIAVPLVLAAALILKTDSLAAPLAEPALLYVAAVVVSLPIFSLLGLYREVVRFISLHGLMVGWLGALVAAVLLVIVNSTVLQATVPHTAFAIYCALTLIYLVASRLLLRALLHYSRGDRDAVAIYGAGSAGVQLAAALRSSRYMPVAFIDDARDLHGRIVAGIHVHSPAQLADLIARRGISKVLLAVPAVNRRRRREILKSLEQHSVHVQTVPDIGDIVAGRANVADVRDVDASDLLGRDPVPPNESLLGACIRDKVVLVTGAGGSIGSELCRQIIRLRPSQLLLLEMSEHALYQVDRELRAIAVDEELTCEPVALLGNAHHRERLREIMRQYGVQTVYHAAAYKHVPIVEQNIIEGIHNNVFSTLYAAEAALACAVETFVLISSDKAVNPTNVMGATKRLAELTLQALQERATHTRFCMVRFGNVLESSGSVVPLFREQIRNGGPVTVTHRDMIRYFMTIPEASQLVLQASAMAQGGDVFVLDMSEPVRIAELARRMILLMGLSVRDEANPDGDIEIVYTGLRPAEKLYEELLIGKNAMSTEHPMIMRATEPHVPWSDLNGVLVRILAALETFDCEVASELLLQTVAGYHPSSGLGDLVWLRGQRTAAMARTNVASLEARRQKHSR